MGYVVGKPLGITIGSWMATRPALRGPRSPLSGPLLAAGGAVAGVGFTISLLISSIAFSGQELDEARLGALASVVLAPVVAWVVLRVVRQLPRSMRARQIARTAEDILDLSDDVDPERDHIRGPDGAPVTLVEYGDFECTYCGQAEVVIRELLTSFDDDVRYVWRHLPLNDVHPTPSWPPRPRKPRRHREPSGTCTTSSSAIRASCARSKWRATPSSSGSTPSA